MNDTPLNALRAHIAGRIAAGEQPIVEHAIRETTYGTVTTNEHGTSVRGSAYELLDWARRPGHAWPCSVLARLDELTARFDARGDLVDLEGDTGYDVPADELNAWTSDVLRDAGLIGHPAIRDDAERIARATPINNVTSMDADGTTFHHHPRT